MPDPPGFPGVALVIRAAASVPGDAEAVVRAIFAGVVGDADGPDLRTAERLGFRGVLGDVLIEPDGVGPLRVFTGLGDRDRAGPEELRRAAAAARRALPGVHRLAFDLRPVELAGVGPAELAQAIGEGAALAGYKPGAVRAANEPNGAEATANEPSRNEIVLIAEGDSEAIAVGARRATVVGEAVTLTRDLVNCPPSALTPRRFAEIAAALGAEAGLEVDVLDEAALTAEGLGGILGVARGSEEPPRLVRLRYRPSDAPPTPVVALVGKGITFDSGGLSLKPADSMKTMKTDMAGAAAVLATLLACRRLDVPVAVHGYLALSENLPGPAAIKPGDVVTIRNGKTIEVLNTDAEGRLVLADALSLAVEERPDAVIDLATLTGAVSAALGRSIAGLMGNDDRLIEAVEQASRVAGEPTWPLPLPAGYRGQLDSDLADLKNVGPPGEGGALLAGLVLEEFVADVPWVHVDIAGTARRAEATGYLSKGGTGYGVRTLLALLARYEPLGGVVVGEARGKDVLR